MPNLNTGLTSKHDVELQRRISKAVKAVLDEANGGDMSINFMDGTIYVDKLQPIGTQIRITLTYQLQPKDKTPD